MLSRVIASRWAFLVFACVPGIALAQATSGTPQIELERLQFDPAGVTSIVVGGGRILPEGEFRVGAAVQYELNPILASNDGGQSWNSVVQDRLTAHILAAWAVHSRIEIGVNIPIIAYQDSANPSKLLSQGLTSVPSTALSNPYVNGRLAILKTANDDPLDLAFHLGVGIPIGNGAALGNNGSFELEPRLQAGRQFGDWFTSLQVGGLIRQSVSLGNQQSFGSQLDFDASVAYQLGALRPEIIGRLFVPFGGLPAGGEAMLGARHQITPEVDAFALVGMGFGNLVGVPAFRVAIGAAFDGGKKPPPAPPPPVVEKKPEPPPPPPDPCSPGQKHTPEQCPNLDDDNDGILNKDDKCPLEPGLPKYDGCPMPDRDKDGIADEEDECPDEPGPAETHGCPDRDHDGVPDKFDNCPDEPGPKENQGCPIKKKQLVVITREKLEIHDVVYFDFGKATIQKRSFNLLDQVADVIKNHPELTKIQVQGHTDNKGSAAYNKKLSDDRAHSVRDYLIKKGVEDARLEAQGFGLERPIVPNDTSENRAKNRRVEFVIVGQPGPTKVEAIIEQPAGEKAAEPAKPGEAKPAETKPGEKANPSETPEIPGTKPEKEKIEKPAPEQAPAAPAKKKKEKKPTPPKPEGSEATKADAPAGAATASEAGAQTYTIKKGETLEAIASRYGVKVKDLLKANPDLRVDEMKAKTVIKLPANAKLKPETEAPVTPLPTKPASPGENQ